ncbi:DNA-binding IclR family transcriptional regulator [Amycolatopsis bartoniae]|uniref:IclR family transcriptional regulator n=1 Tax=Amycolatopsis bartoniae TaxID=941986 RepID=A0A8H9MAN2_9PSEU|nr:helix-turn-helix domain-containing protein [Amycolatopsis bartoniae]MBB2933350.1 DNA-binding IclR family transcriptional regulator [Amycolatopsis bartoniae]TVT08047.1 helix-turn-helix domain-containing protein [Amycolatopsis bartoniae]GHF58883.1 IclR family transcriptional regulator [Amycolatopsis bartoniae]
MTAEGSLTLDRGLALLQAVADAGGEAATISELATRIGASRAAVYRLLVPLGERGLVRRDGNKVRLGVAVLRLAGQVVPQLREVARPVLRALAERTGATAHLSIAEGDQVEAVAVVEPSWTNVHVAYRVGTRHPAGTGAAGKALALRQSGRGWAVSTGEIQRGVTGLAAPVRGVPGLRASVGVLALGRIPAETTGPEVVAAATELAAELK